MSRGPSAHGLDPWASIDPRAKPTAVRYILLYEVHGIDSTWFGTFGDGPDTRGANAMLHKNTVFHGILKHIPWLAFDRLVEQHGADAGVRRLTTKEPVHGIALWPVVGGIEPA